MFIIFQNLEFNNYQCPLNTKVYFLSRVIIEPFSILSSTTEIVSITLQFIPDFKILIIKRYLFIF